MSANADHYTAATPTRLLARLSGPARFAEIRPEHVTPGGRLCCWPPPTRRSSASTSDAVPADYDALSAVLDVATERLSSAWGAVAHLNHVADNPELRAAYNENMPRVVDFYTRVGADERLFAKYRAVAAGADAAQLSPTRRKAIANWLRDFRLGGAELEGPAK